MLRRSWAACRRAAPAAAVRSQLTPIEAFTQLQLGIVPSLPSQRTFLLEYCERQLESLGITEAKLFAMDGRLCTQLTKKLVFDLYLAVPFRVFTFDMEFTGPPVFTAEGPTEDITELGLYSPRCDETFSCLVKPVCGRKQGPGVEKLTHITDKMLATEGVPFVEAWKRFLDFVQTPQPDELPGSEKRILLLSHGGKLADVSLIKWTLEKFQMELPSSFVFGDTIHIIRDAHRRRPVTIDRHPPSWKLEDLVQWLRVPPTLPAHRAGNDARMTWDALYHTLLRYGDDDVTPREQLVSRFFDEEARRRLRDHVENQKEGVKSLGLDGAFLLADAQPDNSGDNAANGDASNTPTTDLLDLDFDDIFSNDALKTAGSVPIAEFKLDGDELGEAVATTVQTPSSSTSDVAFSAPAEAVNAEGSDRGVKNDPVAVVVPISTTIRATKPVTSCSTSKIKVGGVTVWSRTRKQRVPVGAPQKKPGKPSPHDNTRVFTTYSV
ncbi:Exonuclease [Novymonas esmeraldas]|uniref:Exonuclease n=1 Tax=Novymonas esmeraldas TaxID=1808958 RepID=A0AAW0F3E2_9TRYP